MGNTIPGVAPVSGIQGFTISDPEATPFEVHGGPVDPAHSQWGEQSEPYSWESQLTGYSGTHGPYGIDGQLISPDIESQTFAAGTLSQDPTADLTPYYGHGAPWPKDPIGDGSVRPDNIARQLIQSREIHGVKTNAGSAHLHQPTMEANQDTWQDFYEVEPGQSLQVPIPKQVGFAVGGFGSRDRVQSLAEQNEYGFDSAHMHRRYATGSIPGNYMWMRPGSRPLVKTFTNITRLPTGTDSPFEGDDTGASFGIYGAILQDTPTEYQTPPEPNLAPPSYSVNEPAPAIAMW